MRRLLIILSILFLAFVGIAAWFVQDANRFKTALVAYAEREIGIPMEIRGGLEWRLQPWPGLMARDLHMAHRGRMWTVDELFLRPKFTSMARNPTTPANWEIAEIAIGNLNVDAMGGNLRAQHLRLRDIRLGGAVPLEAKLVHTHATRAPIDIALRGTLMFTADRLRMDNLAFKLPNADGICDLEVLGPAAADTPTPRAIAPSPQTPQTAPIIGPPASPQPGGNTQTNRRGETPQTAEDTFLPPDSVRSPEEPARLRNGDAEEADAILPLDFMRAYDWDGRCDFHRLRFATELVENAHVVLDNKEGSSVVSARAPSALGGEAQLQMVVHAAQTPVAWEIEPHLANVDGLRLGRALGMEGPIAAPLSLNGRIGMAGNTAYELAETLDADIRFATGAGTVTLDFDWILAPLAEIIDQSPIPAPGTPHFGSEYHSPHTPAPANSEPTPSATFNYESLSGAWRGTGERHRLGLALDGLSLEAEGTYHLPKDQLGLLGVLTLGESAQRWGLPLPPSVAALSFHFRCGGGLGRPDCRLDAERTFLGTAADRGRAKADEFIDGFVPEGYRGRARSLLDYLESGVDSALLKTPDAMIDEQVPEGYRDAARSLLDVLRDTPEEKQ